jgi:hypothetical protein
MKKIVLLAILFLLVSSPAFSAVQRYNVAIDNSPQKGPKDAPVTLIEFLDFQ